MRIFLKTGPHNHTIFVTPGEDSDCSDFFMSEADGTKTKRQFTVRFKNGEVEVPSNLGRYMIDKGLAQRSRIILPENAVSAAAPEHRATTMRHLGVVA